jgi:hypothetical protein
VSDSGKINPDGELISFLGLLNRGSHLWDWCELKLYIEEELNRTSLGLKNNKKSINRKGRIRQLADRKGRKGLNINVIHLRSLRISLRNLRLNFLFLHPQTSAY